MIIEPQILYLLPIPDEPVWLKSPFQGFSNGLLDRLHFAFHVPTLPPNAFELFASETPAVLSRIASDYPYHFYPIVISQLAELSLRADNLFVVVFSEETLFPQVCDWVSHQSWPILHVSSAKTIDTITID